MSDYLFKNKKSYRNSLLLWILCSWITSLILWIVVSTDISSFYIIYLYKAALYIFLWLIFFLIIVICITIITWFIFLIFKAINIDITNTIIINFLEKYIWSFRSSDPDGYKRNPIRVGLWTSLYYNFLHKRSEFLFNSKHKIIYYWVYYTFIILFVLLLVILYKFIFINYSIDLLNCEFRIHPRQCITKIS